MFLTRSIRSKMMSVLTGVLLMLALLAGSGIWGLLSYRDLVNDPVVDERDSGTAAEVLAAVARLRQAVAPVSADGSFSWDRDNIARRTAAATSACASYLRRLKELPRVIQQQQYYADRQQIDNLDQRLRSLAQLHDRRVPVESRALVAEVEQLERMAADLSDVPDTLRQRLHHGRATYRSGIAIVVTGSLLVAALLWWMVRFGYRHVLQPIQELHQGARRVAQGDFDYRVTINSDDEVGELAESFNMMTARFQEIATDLDSQVKARSQQLVRSERLASVGFLAAGVAHEINNPLTAIRWTSESLESRLAELLKDAPDDDASIVLRYVRMIQTESERCQEITRKLLDFSRGHDSERSANDVAGIVREVVSLIGHMQKYRSAKLIFERSEACVIQINGREIKQVVLNLVANGLDATNGSGIVQVEIVEGIDAIELRFLDDGCGMTPETIENLFQPFYTTKPTGEGTGLGLSISHRIVTDHGGSIEVRSAGPGCGSTFVVRLPRVSSSAATHRPRLAAVLS